MSNVYYDPKDFGLEPVASLNTDAGSYVFDMFIVWKDKHGEYYWAQDAGCSCPSPFENVTLETLEHGSMAQAVEAGKRYKKANQDSWSYRVTPDEWAAFKRALSIEVAPAKKQLEA